MPLPKTGVFGQRLSKGKADDRSTSRHLLYGALVAGPDHNDVFLCGKEHLRWLPVPGTKDHDFFYQFPNRAEPVRKEGYKWDAADLPFQDVMDSQFNEVALDYNAGFTASLAWLCARGLSAGAALPDTEFPPKAVSNVSLDVLSTDREFFVVAKRAGGAADATEIEATLWNRSRWPARVSTNLSFRYFFTLDGDAQPEQVQATLTGSNTAKVSKVRLLAGKTAYVEVSFPGDAIYPGNMQLASRTVKLQLTAPGWSAVNDWSAEALGEKTKLSPRFVAYDGGKLIAGDEPVTAP